MELKYQIQKLMQQRGVSCTPNQIFLTNGAQQAIQLLCKALIDKDETAVTDAAIYPGFIQAAQLSGIPLTLNPVSFSDGMNMDSLEYLCQNLKKPKFIYTMSEGHNPLGISLSKEKRLKLVEIAQTYKIPIIEDDAYGFLNYQPIEPPLKAYNPDWVFYIGSFSKILAPTARVGWIIAPEFLIDKLAILKEGNDINTTTFSQRIISSFLEKNDFSAHLSLLKNAYQEKRDKMVNAFKKYIPEIKFIIPSSGFLIWAQLPKEIDANQLFWHALKNEKVSFLPGAAFTTSSTNNLNNCLRLSYSYCPLDLIETGIKRIANAIQSYPFNNE
jgi:2-aminoadipate transaminase